MTMIGNRSQSNLLKCVAVLLGHFISLTILSQFTSSSAHSEDRITNLELENQQQDAQIHLLKEEASENRYAIQQMEDNFKELSLKIAGTNNNNYDNFDQVYSLYNIENKHKEKRPARLLPLQLLNNKANQTEDKVIVPSSCNYLSSIGHTLNGFFLVKGENSPKVDVVFCNFQPPKQQSSFTFGLLGTKTTVTVIENKIGYVNVISSSGVYFSSFSQNGKVAKSGILLFDKVYLNIGNGIDTSTSIFSAPKAGIYHFAFSILKEGYAFTGVSAHLRLNENKLGIAHVGDGLFSSQGSLQSTLKLKKGDHVDVWISQGKIHEAHKRSNHFTGWLLEEYLEK